MINPIHFSGQLLRTVGNLLDQQQESTNEATQSSNHSTTAIQTIPNSELHIAYMNINQNVILVILKGPLDGNTYETLINLGEALLPLKADCLIVDMSEVSTLTNSGLVALNNLIRRMNGKSSTDIDQGWKALHDMEADFQAGLQSHVKILSPQHKVFDLLSKSGLTQICEVFNDLDTALKPLGWIAKD